MLNNFRNSLSLLRSLGRRWFVFRVGYALRRRTGFIRWQMPSYDWKDRPLETWLKKDVPAEPEAYARWRKQNLPTFFFKQPILPEGVLWDTRLAGVEAEKILNGEIKYFSHQFLKTGFPPDWHKDPVSGTKLDSHRYWSEISNDSETDIKFIWEASRFSMVYTLVRAYASSRDERYAEAFWELIQAWAESNPPNTGPNWMDGQEAALRLMAWMFGFYAFVDSPSTTSDRIAQFTVLVAAQAERIHQNIGFAISTESNHTISEALGLWMVGLLFPELKHAEKYLAFGRKLLEQEAAAQIFPDGSYAMHSINYHRFVLHVYLFAIRLGALNGSPFSESLKSRVAKSVDFLSQLIDRETGQMPVYGSNDGALVLPLNNCDFTDYRPLLQLGSYLTKKESLFEPGPWDEDIFWLCGEQSLTLPFSQRERGRLPSPPGRRAGDEGESNFPHGGIYILRGTNSKAVIRCTDFRTRPSHADQLHVDLWLRGENIACDAGTYLYTGQGIWRNGLAHTAAHNTVVVDHQDQMKMVSRFVWTHWARGQVLKQDEKIWQGQHDGYHKLPDPITHNRTVLIFDEDRWLVVDQLHGKQNHHYVLHWLLCDGQYGAQTRVSPRRHGDASANGLWLVPTKADGKPSDSRVYIQMGLTEGNGNFSLVRADPSSTRGWRSRYYGHKEPAISAMLQTNRPRACFWSYFGFEPDKIELLGNNLKISSSGWNVEIHLDEINK